MVTKLEARASEGSSYVIIADFVEKTSENRIGTPVAPNPGLVWSLRDGYGNVINERENVPLDSAESVTVVLSGDDLALTGDYPETRYITFEGSYNNEFGTIPFIKQASFQIEDLV